MKIIKPLFILSTLIIFLSSCSSFKEVGSIMRNEKSKSTDEFLIKKKEPLTLPPDYSTIPEPGTPSSKIKKKSEIEKIFKITQSKNNNSSSTPSSTEKSILDKIK